MPTDPRRAAAALDAIAKHSPGSAHNPAGSMPAPRRAARRLRMVSAGLAAAGPIPTLTVRNSSGRLCLDVKPRSRGFMHMAG